MPDVLITDFFTRQTKTSEKSKKRHSSKLDQDEDPEWTPTKTAKRTKVTTGKGKLEAKEKSTRPRSSEPALGSTDGDVTLISSPRLPIQTPGASSSRFKMPPAKRKVMVISADEPDVIRVGNASYSPPNADLFSQYRSPLPLSSAPSSSRRYGRKTLSREESVIPPTPEREPRLFTTSKDAVTPIRLSFKPLSQTWSDETVGSSQSQEDDDLEEYGGASINLAGTIFGAPRSNWATKGSVDFKESVGGVYNGGTSPVGSQVIRSSQSQSQYLSMEHASPQRLRGKATVLIDESSEVVESSQSQEKELDMTIVPSQRGGRHLRRSTTPHIPHPSLLEKALSLTKELPVRRLSLYEEEDPGPLADDTGDSQSLIPNGSQFTPRRSRRETQGWNTPSQRQVASTLLEFNYAAADQSCPLISPSRSVRFGSSQGVSLIQPFAFTQPSQALPSLPSTQGLPKTALREESQTQESTRPSVPARELPVMSPQSSLQSLPSEVKMFHAMFQAGEEGESYPLDFPMSLRF